MLHLSEGLGVDPHVHDTVLLPRSDMLSTEALNVPFILKHMLKPTLSSVHSDHSRWLLLGEKRHLLFSIMHSLWVSAFNPWAINTSSIPATSNFLSPALTHSGNSGSYFQLPNWDLQKVTQPKQNSWFSPKSTSSWSFPISPSSYLTQNLLIRLFLTTITVWQ